MNLPADLHDEPTPFENDVLRGSSTLQRRDLHQDTSADHVRYLGDLNTFFDLATYAEDSGDGGESNYSRELILIPSS